MGSGTIGDPERCRKTLGVFAKLTAVGGVGVYSRIFYKEMSKRADFESTAQMADEFSRLLPSFAAGMGAHLLIKSDMFPPHRLVQRIWQDCGGGGWLKKHLDAAKAKIQAGVAKAKSLVPQPEPTPIPIALMRWQRL